MSDWYERNYPGLLSTDGQRRCLAVLEAWQPLYNIHPTGRTRPDGGFQACGDGVVVNVRDSLSTFDNDSLTRLVVAAHRHLVRLDIGATTGGALRIQLNPRRAEGGMFEYHPDLRYLASRCEVRTNSTVGPR